MFQLSINSTRHDFISFNPLQNIGRTVARHAGCDIVVSSKTIFTLYRDGEFIEDANFKNRHPVNMMLAIQKLCRKAETPEKNICLQSTQKQDVWNYF